MIGGHTIYRIEETAMLSVDTAAAAAASSAGGGSGSSSAVAAEATPPETAHAGVVTERGATLLLRGGRKFLQLATASLMQRMQLTG